MTHQQRENATAMQKRVTSKNVIADEVMSIADVVLDQTDGEGDDRISVGKGGHNASI